jgi:hypothetical protein
MDTEKLRQMLEKTENVCAGCQRPELHKLCPAWGTPKYMSGELFTKEMEVEYADVRKAAIERARLGPSMLD